MAHRDMLDPARERKLAELFAAWADTPRSDQAAALERLALDDAELAAVLRRLLQFDTQRPAQSVPQELAAIGPYHIERRLGEGGMGVVYAAWQTTPIRRRVALKVVRGAVATPRLRARFLAERQALARMDHPSIARIYDAGVTDDGLPWFAMELVVGAPLLQFCAEQRLDVRARVRLFLAVCAAVQHAHQRGILHRDLKPHNVLVTAVDGQPLPKVIDFGVARVMTEGSEDDPTAAGQTLLGEIVGTPDYMSPEQCEPGGVVDSRSDVYALGVTLYELLTSSLPFRRFVAGERRWSDVLRERIEAQPVPPSARARTPALRRDLDHVVMKCLAREPAQRYASVSELGADLQRYLDFMPVLAGPPSLLYRVSRFCARHRLAVFGGLALAVALVVGFVGTLLGWLAARDREELLRLRLYAATVTQAQAALTRRDWRDARQLLASCAPELRGFEWQHCQDLAEPSRAPVCSVRDLVALLPVADTEFVAVGRDGELTRYDLAGRELARATSSGCVAAVVAARADVVALAHTDGRVTLWRGLGGALAEFTVEPPVAALALSPRGERLAVVQGGRVLMWSCDVPTAPPLLLRPAAAVERARAVAFAPRGDALAVVGSQLTVFEVPTGRMLLDAVPLAPALVPDLKESLDVVTLVEAERFLVATPGRLVRRSWPALVRGEGAPEQVLEVAGTGLAVSRDELRLARGGGNLTVLDTDSGARLLFAPGPGDVPLALLGGDGAEVVLCATALGVTQQAAVGGEAWLALPFPGRVPRQAVSSARRDLLVSDDPDSSGVVVWHGESLRPLRRFANGGAVVTALSLAGERVWVGRADGELACYDARDGARRLLVPAPKPTDAAALVFVRECVDGTVVVADRGGAVRVLAADGVLRHSLRCGSDDVLLGEPSRGSLLLGGRDGRLERVTLAAPYARRVVRAHGVAITALSEHGADRLLIGYADGRVESVDAESATAGSALVTNLGAVRSLVLMSDGERVLVAHQGGELALWSLRAGARLLYLPATHGAVVLLAGDAGIAHFGTADEVIGLTLGGATHTRTMAALALAMRRVTALCRTGHLAADMPSMLAANPGLRAAERELAGEIAEVLGDDPNRLSEEAWRIVRQPGRTGPEYARAQRLIEVALRAQPQFAPWRNTLGLALYRRGEFAAARDVLRDSESGNQKVFGRTMPHDVLFLAMARWHVGEREAARGDFQRARQLMRVAENAADPEALAFLGEAERLIRD